MKLGVNVWTFADAVGFDTLCAARPSAGSHKQPNANDFGNRSFGEACSHPAANYASKSPSIEAYAVVHRL